MSDTFFKNEHPSLDQQEVAAKFHEDITPKDLAKELNNNYEVAQHYSDLQENIPMDISLELLCSVDGAIDYTLQSTLYSILSNIGLVPTIQEFSDLTLEDLQEELTSAEKSYIASMLVMSKPVTDSENRQFSIQGKPLRVWIDSLQSVERIGYGKLDGYSSTQQVSPQELRDANAFIKEARKDEMKWTYEVLFKNKKEIPPMMDTFSIIIGDGSPKRFLEDEDTRYTVDSVHPTNPDKYGNWAPYLCDMELKMDTGNPTTKVTVIAEGYDAGGGGYCDFLITDPHNPTQVHRITGEYGPSNIGGHRGELTFKKEENSELLKEVTLEGTTLVIPNQFQGKPVKVAVEIGAYQFDAQHYRKDERDEIGFAFVSTGGIVEFGAKEEKFSEKSLTYPSIENFFELGKAQFSLEECKYLWELIREIADAVEVTDKNLSMFLEIGVNRTKYNPETRKIKIAEKKQAIEHIKANVLTAEHPWTKKIYEAFVAQLRSNRATFQPNTKALNPVGIGENEKFDLEEQVVQALLAEERLLYMLDLLSYSPLRDDLQSSKLTLVPRFIADQKILTINK